MNVSPGGASDALALGAHAGQNGVDAVLVDRAQCVGGEAQAHPAVFALHPEPAALQVGQEPALGLVVGMRHVVANHGTLAGDLTHSSHRSLLRIRLPGLEVRCAGACRARLTPARRVEAEKPLIMPQNSAWIKRLPLLDCASRQAAAGAVDLAPLHGVHQVREPAARPSPRASRRIPSTRQPRYRFPTPMPASSRKISTRTARLRPSAKATTA